ncbi:heme exporter protein CcmD [Loktanella salsilacus]
MPDLGKYAIEVLTAYAASIAVLAVLIVASLRRSRRVKAALEAVERG